MRGGQLRPVRACVRVWGKGKGRGRGRGPRPRGPACGLFPCTKAPPWGGSDFAAARLSDALLAGSTAALLLAVRGDLERAVGAPARTAPGGPSRWCSRRVARESAPGDRPLRGPRNWSAGRTSWVPCFWSRLRPRSEPPLTLPARCPGDPQPYPRPVPTPPLPGSPLPRAHPSPGEMKGPPRRWCWRPGAPRATPSLPAW